MWFSILSYESFNRNPVPKFNETEIDYFQKYRILSDNHPAYWKDLEKSIRKIYPEANFVSISFVRSTEDLIKENQGVSYLPTYWIFY